MKLPGANRYEVRVASFAAEGWDRSRGPAAADLAAAGFYCARNAASGVLSATCYDCGVAVATWADADDPWVKHYRLSPFCRHRSAEPDEDRHCRRCGRGFPAAAVVLDHFKEAHRAETRRVLEDHFSAIGGGEEGRGRGRGGDTRSASPASEREFSVEPVPWPLGPAAQKAKKKAQQQQQPSSPPAAGRIPPSHSREPSNLWDRLPKPEPSPGAGWTLPSLFIPAQQQQQQQQPAARREEPVAAHGAWGAMPWAAPSVPPSAPQSDLSASFALEPAWPRAKTIKKENTAWSDGEPSSSGCWGAALPGARGGGDSAGGSLARVPPHIQERLLREDRHRQHRQPSSSPFTDDINYGPRTPAAPPAQDPAGAGVGVGRAAGSASDGAGGIDNMGFADPYGLRLSPVMVVAETRPDDKRPGGDRLVVIPEGRLQDLRFYTRHITEIARGLGQITESGDPL